MAIRDYISERHHDRIKISSSSLAQKLGSQSPKTPVRIKAVGVGNGGCNTVMRLMDQPVPGMNYALVNTDGIAMAPDDRVDVIQIVASKEQSWGAPKVHQTGEDFFDDFGDSLRNSLAGADLVFITAGMGGGAGTSVAPHIARLAKQQRALVVALVTAPFAFEGRRRMGLAVAGVDQLRPNVDSLILIHNDRLLGLAERNARMVQAFQAADEVVGQGILGISESLNLHQEMNLSLSDVSSTIDCRGGTLMAVGRGSGNDGPMQAAREALANPLLDRSFEMSTGALLMIKGGTGAMTMSGVDKARQIAANALGGEANIFVGVGVDETMGESVRLTLIAAGLQRGGDPP